MAEAARLVLVAEVHGHVAGMGDGVGVAGLAALAQQGLERAVGLEVVEQLGLAGARHDDGAVDLLGVEGLLHHVLDDRLVEDRQHLLGGALGGGQEAGAEAGGGDDSLHLRGSFPSGSARAAHACPAIGIIRYPPMVPATCTLCENITDTRQIASSEADCGMQTESPAGPIRLSSRRARETGTR